MGCLLEVAKHLLRVASMCSSMLKNKDYSITRYILKFHTSPQKSGICYL